MRPAARRVLLQQRAHRVGDLAPPAVPDRDVDLGPADPVAGALLRRLERGGGRGGQQVERAHDAQPPGVALLGQLDDQVLDDLQQRVELGRRPAQVVGRQQVERHVLDDVPGHTSRADSLDLLRADPVPVVGVDVAHLLGPPAVAVAHDADMARHRLAGELGRQAPFVDGVDEIAQIHHYAD